MTTLQTSLELNLPVTIARRWVGAEETVCFELRPLNGEKLPLWAPGAHIEVELNGLLRQYSLCGSTQDGHSWIIAILRESPSRGGSEFAFDHLREGHTLKVTALRNHFPLVKAEKYLFIAGGIGITPILPMIAQAAEYGADWHLIYVGKSTSRMLFIDELLKFGADRVTVHTRDKAERFDFATFLGNDLTGVLLYACGSESLLETIERSTSDWPSESVHIERFHPKELALGENKPFDVELTLSGKSLSVPANKSLLATLEENGFYIPASCEEGTCGTCLTKVVAGRVDHRDSLMSAADQEKNDAMYVCVSRALDSKLSLEL